jgi:PKD repeat protein
VICIWGASSETGHTAGFFYLHNLCIQLRTNEDDLNNFKLLAFFYYSKHWKRSYLMYKIRKTFGLTGVVIALLVLSTFAATAQQPYTGFLDAYENSADGFAGPVFTDPLEPGVKYIITVEGTLSIWSRTSWDNVCVGTPEDNPIFPSPSTLNGKVGLDAAYIWSFPSSSPSLCPGGVPAIQVPSQHARFEISLDGGTTWASLTPMETSFNEDHIYNYEVMSPDEPVSFGFRIPDSPLVDNYGQLKITVARANQPPVAKPGGPYYGYEGAPVSFDGSLSSDPDGDVLVFAWDFGDGNTSTLANPVHTYADNGEYAVCLTVTDPFGAAVTGCTIAYISNVAPTVAPIHVDATMVKVGKTIHANADFTDPGILDTHTAVWDWGDGSVSSGAVTEVSGSGNVTGSHAYAHPGEYKITLTVTDKDGDSGMAIFQSVVVYDPKDFVTGGGWIWSPEHACKDACGKIKGKINFGFVAKYNKNLEVPSGQTEFQYKDGNINFHSTRYEWLVIYGAKARYQGVGTINGSGEYGFILSAIDGKLNKGGGGDKIRMKIWNLATGEVIYDTQPGDDDFADPTTPVNGGSINIHDR